MFEVQDEASSLADSVEVVADGDMPPSHPRLRRFARSALKWAGRLGLLLIFLALTPVVATGAVLSPYVKDDLVLDRVVRTVALDWRDFGKDTAKTRLEYELDRQGIGMQVTDDDCTLTEDGVNKVVQCRWQAAFVVPGVIEPMVLPFASRATIAENGDLR